MSMYLIINIIGLIVFLGIGWLFSKNRKEINWKTVGIMVVLNLLLAWFLVSSAAGRAGVKAAADGFAWIVNVSAKGTVFELRDWYTPKNLNFICSALMPILMIVPLVYYHGLLSGSDVDFHSLLVNLSLNHSLLQK